MATTRVCLLLSVLLPAAVCQGDSQQSECQKAARASRSEKCQAPDISNLKFSLSSHRNQTGHWVAQVNVHADTAVIQTKEWRGSEFGVDNWHTYKTKINVCVKV